MQIRQLSLSKGDAMRPVYRLAIHPRPNIHRVSSPVHDIWDIVLLATLCGLLWVIATIILL